LTPLPDTSHVARSVTFRRETILPASTAFPHAPFEKPKRALVSAYVCPSS
jgi:hypothetical protein